MGFKDAGSLKMSVRSVAGAILLLSILFGLGRVVRRRTETSLATFNAGIVHFYPGASGGAELEERTGLLIEQVKSSDVDILCLQEVLDAGIQRQIYAALKDQYPYVLSALNLSVEGESTERACKADELQKIAVCAQMQCPGLTGKQLFGCFSVRCLDASVSISPLCRDCITVHFPSNRQEQCAGLPASRFEVSYGLMLLSKKELRDTRASGFNPQSQFRGYLEASVDGVGDLLCTHLSSLASTQVYGGPPIVSPYLYTNYDEQQYDELATLFNLTSTMENPILLGDFNHGPLLPEENFTWELPFHYGLMVARGFVSPFVLADGRCTFCIDNPSVNFVSNLVIDHIYVTADAYKERVSSVERFLDDVLTTTGSALSDHYGILMTLKDIRYNCNWLERILYHCPAEGLHLEKFPVPHAELGRLCVAAGD